MTTNPTDTVDTNPATPPSPTASTMTDPYADDPAFVLHQGGKLDDRLAGADRRTRGPLARLHARRRPGVAGDRRRARSCLVAHRPFERRRRAVQRHRRARPRRHRPRSGDGGDGGQGRAVQAVRRRRRLPGVRQRAAPSTRWWRSARRSRRRSAASTSRTSRRPSASRSSAASRKRSTSRCSTTISTARPSSPSPP